MREAKRENERDEKNVRVRIEVGKYISLVVRFGTETCVFTSVRKTDRKYWSEILCREPGSRQWRGSVSRAYAMSFRGVLFAARSKGELNVCVDCVLFSFSRVVKKCDGK
uniref:(northern house mosquito) hypothetical protein n=1 Tax=Culex pipiens TaxID=7175 RepID=A0A8D8EUU5_CULPI